MIIPIFIIGLVSSIATQVLTLFPVLSRTKERKRVVAFIVALVFSFLYLVSEREYVGRSALVFVIGVLAASFAIYKSLVQTIVKLADIRVRK